VNKAGLLRRLRNGTRIIAIALLTVGLSAGGWALYLQIVGNIHAVTPGVVYRSAQLNGERLADTLKQYQIKSVINLRGDNVDENWYTDELKVTAMQGAQHYDLGMYAKEQPDAKTIKRMFEILRTAPRPLLIHCNSGSDRTGLVAAVYKHFIEGRSAEEAAGQLSFRFGHFPWLGSGTKAMDETFERLTSGKIDWAATRSGIVAIP
jgi:protein tyrosine/serine phosphatase